MIYRSNKWVCITEQLTTEWFENHFIVEARQHCHKMALLEDCEVVVLDCCRAQPSADVLVFRNVFATFYLPSCTLQIQPMDQGIIHNIKFNYRSEFMGSLVNFDSSSVKLDTFKKKLNIKYCIYSLARAWQSITVSTDSCLT